MVITFNCTLRRNLKFECGWEINNLKNLLRWALILTFVRLRIAKLIEIKHSEIVWKIQPTSFEKGNFDTSRFWDMLKFLGILCFGLPVFPSNFRFRALFTRFPANFLINFQHFLSKFVLILIFLNSPAKKSRNNLKFHEIC